MSLALIHLLSSDRCCGALRKKLQRGVTDAGSSLNAPTEVVKQIIINIEAGVEVEVTIAT